MLNSKNDWHLENYCAIYFSYNRLEEKKNGVIFGDEHKRVCVQGCWKSECNKQF